ncbi:hypothetical protein CEXT_803981 [Caerostris extrusa]|uniref:Uncharacterized protein n=1 Tax=Caerostris extrusa TaxID=172846 RepID=A0AAV4Y4B3_CAEEX|nr:hypothetical protein CEXT_803981 [Caerostris extrusa]
MYQTFSAVLCKSCFYRHSAGHNARRIIALRHQENHQFLQKEIKSAQNKTFHPPSRGVAHHLFLLGYGIKREWRSLHPVEPSSSRMSPVRSTDQK